MNTNPKWQDINERFIALLEDHFKNCTQCHHWGGPHNEICGKYNIRPPATIIVKGCESYEAVPF